MGNIIRRFKLRVGEMVYSMKSLLYKPKDLSSDTQHTCIKKAVCGPLHMEPHLGTGGFQIRACLVLPNQVSSNFSETLRLNHKVGKQ